MDPPSSPPTTPRRGWVHGRVRPNGSLQEGCAPGNAPLKNGRSPRGLRNGLSVRAIGRVQAIAHAASESRPGLRTPEIVRNHLHDGRGAVRIAHVLHRSPGTATVLVRVPRSSSRRDDQSLTSLVGAMVGPTRDPTITYPPDDLTRTAARAGAPRSEVLRSRLARGGAQPNALFRRSGRAVRHAKGRVAGFCRWPRAICATAGEAAPPGTQQTLGGISGGRCRPCERDHGYGAGTEAVVGPTTDLASHGPRPVQHRRPSSMPARRIRILG
ncbi:hypothetical protein MBT84_09420 [Streptomyces sp. MBT84]|nr:hypothetical protein [Streptomyces sp. MBT84]